MDIQDASTDLAFAVACEEARMKDEPLGLRGWTKGALGNLRNSIWDGREYERLDAVNSRLLDLYKRDCDGTVF